MRQIGVNEGVSEERPQIRAKAARKRHTGGDIVAAVTGRNKCELENERDTLFVGEQETQENAHHMNEHKYGDGRHHDSRNVEDGF
jgi:hypothetical protein